MQSIKWPGGETAGSFEGTTTEAGVRSQRTGMGGVTPRLPGWAAECGELRGEKIDDGRPDGDVEPSAGEAGGKSRSQGEESPAHTDPFSSRLGDRRG